MMEKKKKKKSSSSSSMSMVCGGGGTELTSLTTIEQQLPHHHYNNNYHQISSIDQHNIYIPMNQNFTANSFSIQTSPPSPSITIGCCSIKRQPPRPPQEIYFESRGKCCKKLLRYNGYPNKVLLYPEEGWARSAASSYWTITPCRWRRNTCIVEEVAGSRKTAKVSKTNPKQFEIIVDYMENHRDLATNKLVGTQYKEKSNFLWNELTTQVNAEGPPVRNSDGWKKVWKDIKYYTTSKLTYNLKGKNQTGGGKFKEKIITALEERIIGICKLRTRAQGLNYSHGFGIEKDVPQISPSEIENTSVTIIPNLEGTTITDEYIDELLEPLDSAPGVESVTPINESDNTHMLWSQHNRQHKKENTPNHLLKNKLKTKVILIKVLKISTQKKLG